MRLSLRFLIPLLLALGAFAYGAVPLADALMQRWFVRDLDTRSTLITATVEEPLGGLIATGSRSGIIAFFDRMLRDERLYAVALCIEPAGRPIATVNFLPGIDCAALAAYDTTDGHILPSARGPLYLAVRALDGSRESTARLALLQDMSFVTRRSEEARRLLFYFFVALGLAIALITVVIAQLSWRGWVQGLRALLRGEGILRPSPASTVPELRPIARDLGDLIRDLERQYRPLDGSQRIWDQDALRATLRRELHGNDVIVVANREPYIHIRTPAGIHVQRPASGLVTALEPVMRACSGTWIAHGSGSADRETVDRRDRIAVPPEHPVYQVRRIWLSKEEEQGYYFGFSNEGLWPLCHNAHVRPTFRTTDWEHYRGVNQKFADAVAKESKSRDPVVLVQDYHFALLPRMIREQLPDATILTFWHIPWPNPEAFAICPWNSELLDGMLGSSILGFHTQFHCNNFMDTVDRLLEARVDRESFTITFRGQTTAVHRYPISIEWPPAALARPASVPDCAQGRPRRAWACPRGTGSASASTASTTPRASSSDSTPSTVCSSSSRAGSAASRSSRSPPRAAARSPTIAIYGARVTALAARHQRPLRHRQLPADRPRHRASRAAGCVRIPARRGPLLREQPARRDEPRREGIRRRARRRAGRARAVAVRRRVARAARGAGGQSLRRGPMRVGAAHGAHDGCRGAARAHALHARCRARIQCLSLGRTHAARCGA